MFDLRQSTPANQLPSVDSKAIQCIAVLVALVIFFYFQGEKIEAGNGLGWAGSEYAYSIITFPESLANISEYHIHRAFIPVSFGFLFNLFKIPATPSNITSAFISLNSLSLLALTYLFIRTSHLLKLSTQQFCFCALACILNYAFIKFPSFYPILPDWFATLISSLLFYLWIENRVFWLFILSLIGNFTHPMLVLLSMILLLFPYKSTITLNIRFFMTSSKVIILLITILFAVELYRVFTGAISSPFATSPTCLYAGSITTSVFIIVIYAISSRVCLKMIRHRTNETRLNQIIINVAFALASLLMSTILTKAMSSSGSHLSITSFLENSFLFGSLRPFSFIASHFLYFGPAYLFFLVSYKQVLENSLEILGDAALPLLILFITLGVDSESRHIMIFWPIICTMSSLSLKRQIESFPAMPLLYVALIAIALSQVWFPTNIFRDLSTPSSEFPAQWYFMYHGPWMNPDVYTSMITLIGITYMVFKAARNAQIRHKNGKGA